MGPNPNPGIEYCVPGISGNASFQDLPLAFLAARRDLEKQNMARTRLGRAYSVFPIRAKGPNPNPGIEYCVPGISGNTSFQDLTLPP